MPPPIRVSAKDIDDAVVTAMMEARSEGDEGIEAVLHVMANRSRDSRWPNTISGVSREGEGTKRPQFSGWAPSRYKHSQTRWASKVDRNSAAFQNAKRIAEDVFAGRRADPTGGAVSYLNPDTATNKRELAAHRSAVAAGTARPIGAHTFRGGSDVPGTVHQGGQFNRPAASVNARTFAEITGLPEGQFASLAQSIGTSPDDPSSVVYAMLANKFGPTQAGQLSTFTNQGGTVHGLADLIGGDQAMKIADMLKPLQDYTRASLPKVGLFNNPSLRQMIDPVAEGLGNIGQSQFGTGSVPAQIGPGPLGGADSFARWPSQPASFDQRTPPIIADFDRLSPHPDYGLQTPRSKPPVPRGTSPDQSLAQTVDRPQPGVGRLTLPFVPRTGTPPAQTVSRSPAPYTPAREPIDYPGRQDAPTNRYVAQAQLPASRTQAYEDAERQTRLRAQAARPSTFGLDGPHPGHQQAPRPSLPQSRVDAYQDNLRITDARERAYRGEVPTPQAPRIASPQAPSIQPSGIAYRPAYNSPDARLRALSQQPSVPKSINIGGSLVSGAAPGLSRFQQPDIAGLAAQRAQIAAQGVRPPTQPVSIQQPKPVAPRPVAPKPVAPKPVGAARQFDSRDIAYTNRQGNTFDSRGRPTSGRQVAGGNQYARSSGNYGTRGKKWD